MTELEPADLEQCQADVPNGYNVFTLGGVPGRIRCTNKPIVVVHETEPADDGLMGSMSLCSHCLNVFNEQLPDKAIKVEAIE